MKVLIVDDEALINQYIVQCVREASPEAEIVGAVTTGTKALKILEENSVDVVFADITMPKMDGLTLLEEIKKRMPHVEVVMLTCHDEFEYVRKAMKRQAFDYVLKNEVNKEILVSIFDRLKKKRGEDVAVQEEIGTERKALLGNMIESTEPITVSETELRRLGIYLNNASFVGFMYLRSAENIKNIKTITQNGFSNILFHEYDKIIGLVLMNIDDSQNEESVYMVLPQGVSGVSGVSRIHHNLSRLQQTMKECIRSMDCNFYENCDSPCAEDIQSDEINKKVIRAVLEIEDGDIERGCAEIEKILRDANDSHPHAMTLINAMYQFLGTVKKNTELNYTEFINRLLSCDTYENLCSEMHICIEQMREEGKRYSAAIQKAIDYITEHYAEDVSLNTVADFVYLNRDYLSRQFKKEVGTNFSEYLTSVRMKKAKKMLETTNMRIADVAMSVGIGNISYFSTVFNKTFHMKPNEVRRR